MQRCIELATNAKSMGHPAVGAILVVDGTIIAEGKEGEEQLPQIMSHAENIAILKAIEKRESRDLSDCTLYTTVEPCFMCAYLIRQTKIKKVVYGTETSAGGDSSAYPILRAEDIEAWKMSAPKVVSGVMRQACESLLL